ncbi:Flagellar biosynthesis protein FlhA [Lacunisphaera limnophila]|uniref:Flagellar biosynthesis protein FlhA n=1 Tax=Lacunisphaera limnophila TaxID=1838286 RepID=A0A1D8AW89_9BACT|nr:flagellar biosynthesis protein FlhA [Lacunisphaera limnophila]AOS45125.1 Flagellar biosynthesis protein FlhA [Lacunisphaera limnophila]
MPVSSSNSITRLLQRADLLFAFGLFGTVLLLVLPVPPFIIDVLLALNIGMSLLVLLAIVYVKDPPEFSGFPVMLLGLTLFRLALNISSTRQILATGYAGEIIESFGHFVIQGNYVVGAVVFIILVLINFVVITKGAGRIAEVSARFTLDALPGKQMAIDAELNAGIIDEVTATARRLKVQKEADFYGAMDGASKFVRGDAVAGILITLVNVLGGFAIGVLQMGLSLGESLQKFTLLSIGDGLVSQIPALIISIGAGLLVTRASDNNNIGAQIAGQIVRYPRALKLAAGCMAVFGLMPGMPLIPFMGLAGLAMFAARSFKDTEGGEAELAPVAAKPGAKGTATPAGKPGEAGTTATAAPATEDVRKLTEVDTFSIEIGYGLLPLAEVRNGGDLLARVTGVRKTLAREKGIVVPPVSVRDNLELEANDYRFLLRGKPLARGTILPGRLLAMNVAGSTIKLRGQPTREPVFNLEATWIDEGERKTAELNNFTVVDPSSVLITHLSETLKANSHLLLGRQDVSSLIDHLKGSHAALVAELLPDLVNLGIIQRVLQNLLREGIAIINLPIILEGIADFASLSKNPDDLSELVRRRLGIYFVPELESRPGALRAITLDPRFEQVLGTKVHRSPTDVGLSLDPATGRHLIDQLNRHIATLTTAGAAAVLVVSTENRLPVKRFLEPSFPRLTVLAYQELPASTEIENAGIIPLPLHLQRQEPVKAAA